MPQNNTVHRHSKNQSVLAVYG